MRALRLNPPEVPFTPELRWVLARAFGPADRPFDEAIDAREACDEGDHRRAYYDNKVNWCNLLLKQTIKD